MADAAAWHNPPITPAQKLAAAMCPCPGLFGELLSAPGGAGYRATVAGAETTPFQNTAMNLASCTPSHLNIIWGEGLCEM